MHPIYDKGSWPFYFGWKKRYDELYDKLINVYGKYAPIADMAAGVSPMEMARVFAENGLSDVSAYPVAAIGENKIWEWQYAPMILLSGKKR
ncbi:hypothetical protein QYZ88_016510 [Lachnospiraceae bacterium C1.1]|nr:hypothetical protein [Lachnospiraceae bacterium C1.1]